MILPHQAERMKEWPSLNDVGDLPPGIHPATLAEVVARFIVFGSFITAKPEPNDVDIFLLMNDDFDVSKVTGEAAILFDHLAAQNYEGASFFWVRRAGALGGEQTAIEDWQIKRDGTRRGIVEVTAP